MEDQRKPVFDDKTRTNGFPQGEMVSTFEFFNDAAGSAWEPPRALIQEWMNHIEDEKEYSDMVERFRSKDDAQFRGVYLELYLHEVLLKAGYSVTLHPEIPGSSKRPDFLVSRGNTKFYLEAIVPALSPSEHAQRKRENTVREALDRISDENFKIFLIDLKGGKENPQAKKLRRKVEDWLSTLDPEEIKETGFYPVEEFSVDDWSIKVEPWIKKPESKDTRGIVGSFHSGAERGYEDIYRGLKTKGKENKYGELDAPYLIAVGIYIWKDADHFHIKKALYDTYESSGGYFGRSEEWKHQNVSGVLIVDQLDPYHFHTNTRTTLWLHPDAKHPLTEDINIPLTVVRKTEEGFIEEPGIRATEFFGLNEEWPEGTRFP